MANYQIKGENNPKWAGGGMRACPICGIETWRKPYQIKKGRLYCSRRCGCKGRSPSYITMKGIPRPWLIAEANSSWKGNKVGYQALHDWIRRAKGTPNNCEHCGDTTKKKYEWANISKQYKRDLTDWIRLCVKCHKVFDGVSEKMKQFRKNNYWNTKKKTIEQNL